MNNCIQKLILSKSLFTIIFCIVIRNSNLTHQKKRKFMTKQVLKFFFSNRQVQINKHIMSVLHKN